MPASCGAAVTFVTDERQGSRSAGLLDQAFMKGAHRRREPALTQTHHAKGAAARLVRDVEPAAGADRQGGDEGDAKPGRGQV